MVPRRRVLIYVGLLAWVIAAATVTGPTANWARSSAISTPVTTKAGTVLAQLAAEQRLTTLAAAGFTGVGNMARDRASFTATLLPSGKVLVASLGQGELYRPETRDFALTGVMNGTRGGHTATLLPNGKVLLVGGGGRPDFPESAIATAELYDPDTGTFSPTGSMALPRAFHTATLLQDGRVLVVGGWQYNFPNSAQATAEIYDPSTGTFASTGSMATARVMHTATLLADGRVLIAGGYSSSQTGLASAEVWDPATGHFSPTGGLSAGRGNQTATRLGDGRVLVAGGFTAFPGGALASAEVHEPTTGSFTSVASMGAPRGDHTATMLNDGTVLVAGGFTAFPFLGTTLSSAEIYLPKTETFTPTGAMAGARGRHVAVRLIDGDVLVAGGLSSCCGSLRTAELYDGPASDLIPRTSRCPKA